MDATPAVLSSPKAALEVADILRQYGEEYRRQYPLSREQREVMRAIEQCRTAARGGHVDECDHCGTLRISYNSCRNRHCPKCGSLDKARWREARQAELLPIEYFHVVFTLDHAINALARCNSRQVYNLLFAAAGHTLKAFGVQYLGGEIGVIAVLHTLRQAQGRLWGQDLGQHIHLHCIVTGGALSPDRTRWWACPTGFLFPVLPLSAAFRDAFCAGLARRHRRGRLTFAGACADLADTTTFAQWLAEMQAKDWQVYIQPPFGEAQQVLAYLARYTQHVAISNYRLRALEEGQVRFTWRDYRDGGVRKDMTLPALEFIRRFLLHVLPKHFVRVRHFGLFSPRYRGTQLPRCRELLDARPEAPPAVEEGAVWLLQRLTGIDLRRCPVCGVGTLTRTLEFDAVLPLFATRQTLPQTVGIVACGA